MTSPLGGLYGESWQTLSDCLKSKSIARRADARWLVLALPGELPRASDTYSMQKSFSYRLIHTFLTCVSIASTIHLWLAEQSINFHLNRCLGLDVRRLMVADHLGQQFANYRLVSLIRVRGRTSSFSSTSST
jgi:hypothetical protein